MWIQCFTFLYTGSIPGFCVLRTWCGKDCKLTTSKLNVHLPLLSNRILNLFEKAMHTTREISFLSLSYQLDVAKWPDVDQWGVSGRAELYFREVLNREWDLLTLYSFSYMESKLNDWSPSNHFELHSDFEKEAKKEHVSLIPQNSTSPKYYGKASFI